MRLLINARNQGKKIVDVSKLARQHTKGYHFTHDHSSSSVSPLHLLTSLTALDTTKPFKAAPATAPITGPTTYTQKPPLGPGMATVPQPAQAATNLGPKSRAGFMPTCVNCPCTDHDGHCEPNKEGRCFFSPTYLSYQKVRI